MKLFDEELVNANKLLVADPSDIEAKVDFVTTYHMVIEGTLALTGQYFNSDYLERNGILKGFVDGFKKVARDEHRHVAYGTWFLKQKCGQDPAMAERMRSTLQRLLPIASGVLVPPARRPARTGRGDARLQLGRDQRVRLQGADPASEGDRGAARRRRGGPGVSTATKQLWICDSCGFVYDTDVGDPDGGIPPGTAFEDIPKDWPSAALERPTSGHSRQARRELGHLAPRVPP